MADLKALEERISRYISDALIEFKAGTERIDWATASMNMADEIIRWVADAVEDATSAALAGAEQATTDARREPPAQPLWLFLDHGDLYINQAHPAITALLDVLNLDGDADYGPDVINRWQQALAADVPAAPCCSGHIPAGGPRPGWCVNAEFDGCEPCCPSCPDDKRIADHEHPGGYLSTACLHELHEPECGAAQRGRGYVGHPTCKFCNAKCVCPCHTGGQVERAERVHADGCTLAANDPHHSSWCKLPDDLVQEQWGVRHANGHSIARDEAEAREWLVEATGPLALIRRTLTTGAWRDAGVPAAGEAEGA